MSEEPQTPNGASLFFFALFVICCWELGWKIGLILVDWN